MNAFNAVSGLGQSLAGCIIGQSGLINRILIALLTDGHLLVEGAPGLAKTRAIKELSERLEGEYQRIQFTPDMLPADITGTEIYRPTDGSFNFQPGPLFNNLILADEINRAPAKVQSALLEAMAEQQISVGQKTYPLPPLFLVMATQNPIEQEGTYPLPEAQLDRFMMHVVVDYPDSTHEADILRLVRQEAADRASDEGQGGSGSPPKSPEQSLSLAQLFEARQDVLRVHMSDDVEQYLVRLTTMTRTTDRISPDMARWVSFGVSPRGTIALDAASRAHAWLAGRDYVSPDDIQSVIHDVLRHRLLLSYEAEADQVTADTVIDQLLRHVGVP